MRITPLSGFVLRVRLVPWVALSDVPQGNLHPGFTSGALRGDPAGGGIDPDDRVADDDFLRAAYQEGDAADRAATPVLLDLDH